MKIPPAFGIWDLPILNNFSLFPHQKSTCGCFHRDVDRQQLHSNENEIQQHYNDGNDVHGHQFCPRRQSAARGKSYATETDATTAHGSIGCRP